MPPAPPYEIIPDAGPPLMEGRITHALALRSGPKEMSAFHHRVDRPNFGLLLQNQLHDKYHISVALNRFSAKNMTRDGKSLGPRFCQPGTTSIYDYRHIWQPEILQPHETFNVYVPHWKFEELRYEYNSPRMEDAASNLTSAHDPVMLALAQALLPALQKPAEASALFVEHMFCAITLHLATSFGFNKSRALNRAGTLAPWQEKRAKDLLRHNVAGDISLQELALACGLSVTYFARAFKSSTGVAPHRWLTALRLEQAKNLMLKTQLPLSEICLLSGFADQSHFTRVFTKTTGVSPGVWRRTHRF